MVHNGDTEILSIYGKGLDVDVALRRPRGIDDEWLLLEGQAKLHAFEKWRSNDIHRARRVDWIETQSGEQIPGTHLAAVFIPGKTISRIVVVG